jgi:hypothetical protein
MIFLLQWFLTRQFGNSLTMQLGNGAPSFLSLSCLGFFGLPAVCSEDWFSYGQFGLGFCHSAPLGSLREFGLTCQAGCGSPTGIVPEHERREKIVSDRLLEKYLS